jgi:hypothetical protein
VRSEGGGRRERGRGDLRPVFLCNVNVNKLIKRRGRTSSAAFVLLLRYSLTALDLLQH